MIKIKIDVTIHTLSRVQELNVKILPITTTCKKTRINCGHIRKTILQKNTGQRLTWQTQKIKVRKSQKIMQYLYSENILCTNVDKRGWDAHHKSDKSAPESILSSKFKNYFRLNRKTLHSTKTIDSWEMVQIQDF